MPLLIVYAVLLILMLFSIGAGIYSKVAPPTLIGQLAGLVGLTAAFLQNLTKNNLAVYFFWQRLRIRFNTKAVTRWSFAARFDGNFDPDVINFVVNLLSNPKLYGYPVRLEASDNRSALLSVDDSLVLSISTELAELAEASKAGGTELDHLAVVSKVQELPYRFSIDKLEQQILPLLNLVRDELRPSKSSYELDVEFRGANPFFDVYIARLRPEQVGEFRVILHVASGIQDHRERVEISRTNIHVIAATTDSFKRLADDFILLSPDVKMLAGVKKIA